MTLIERASQSRIAILRDQEAQQEADKIAQRMRFASERLLLQEGKRIRPFADDEKAGPFGKALARLVLGVMRVPAAYFKGVTPYEMVDHRQYEKDIPVKEGDSVKVTVTSDNANVQKSPGIRVTVTGLDESLVLREDHGEIDRWNPTEVLDGPYLEPRTVWRWEEDRRAGPGDVESWKKDVLDPLTAKPK